MGYSTDFYGEFKFDKPLTQEHMEYINDFSRTRRMKRDVDKLVEKYKGKYGYPGRTLEEHGAEGVYGNEGEYFIGGEGYAGQDYDETVIDGNSPPGQPEYGSYDDFKKYNKELAKRIKNGTCQPGLWCQWVSFNGSDLAWDEGEKFYEFVSWLEYLVNNFFEPWGYKLNGEVEWQGQDFDDRGIIEVEDNEVKIGYFVYDIKFD